MEICIFAPDYYERNSEKGECMDGFTLIYLRYSRSLVGFPSARSVRVG